MFFERTLLFWEGIVILLIFLAKDILISFQRYNDFSDNFVLYYLLHFKNSPCTIRLEVKENFRYFFDVVLSPRSQAFATMTHPSSLP